MKLNTIFQNKKVIITGHTGFKGSWLSVWLHSLGADVYGISMDVPTNPSHFDSLEISKIINDIRIDIRDLISLKDKIHSIKPDFLFHLAAQPLVRFSYQDPLLTYSTNVMGTINVLECLRNLTQECVAVIITSDKCYDNVEWVWGYRETDALGGPDPYSSSKGMAELAIKSYIKSFFNNSDSLVKIGIGRAGNVIGGGDWADDRIVPDCVKAWSKNEVVSLRNPMATRPWQLVLEPLSGYLNLSMALKENFKLHGEAFNFGPASENSQTVLELVKEMKKHWDQVKFEDNSKDYDGPYESGLLKLNCDKALFFLKWKAILDFETTIKMTSEWYKEYYKPSMNTYDFTLKQIQDYTKIAQSKKLLWAK
ncbi:CDP-glucose 4,6-dehydratase [Leptospira vanthielii]|uniref:CDP-glucose 4,6-dehydratase n=1 Tax=Leptospira vanthielii serovar Holland str. Waz Holland = ATCC 700522 TaxID=1218591 RepID=N1W8Q8_9LEPT|nr:CDP-glucose 4,6-dehydratase [Leptospira vanthielii]EMY69562.1 CDP-glucose 4,6-dehydratase [Leptospira vanthielii serovar Holland str. Waz Holland = ATCC 700522]